MQVEVSRYIFAPPGVVWSVLTDWERQADWMVDARAVEVTSSHREGQGVTLVCPTNVLGVTVQDEMRVTEWVEERRLGVEHLGTVITGSGTFLLEETPVGTRIVWQEEIDPPLGMVGEVGARIVVRPYVRWLFGRSLDNLKATVEREARQERTPRA